ncbi:general vesicular transport factor p115-like [Artemia franciscana]
MFLVRSIIGSPGAENAATGAETVERLVERIRESPNQSDRRDACKALRALSKRFRLEVGAKAMECLLLELDKDQENRDIVLIVLETLVNITNPEYHEEEEEAGIAEAPLSSKICPLGEQFSEIFLKKVDNVAVVLFMLDLPSPQIKYTTLKLLINLAKTKLKPLQDYILESRMGISKLIDVLTDKLEFIRNEGLLLLIELTKSNANLQKIVAFENAFDRVYDIMIEEGFGGGSVITQDCLQLTLNLLANNPSNQTSFREGSLIQKYHRLLSSSLEDTSLTWSDQRSKTTILLLRVIRILVSPSNPSQSVTLSQKILNSCGMISTLGQLLLANSVPSSALTETIATVGDAIRGNRENQDLFASIPVNNYKTKSMIVLLILTMISEKQGISMRLCALYALQSCWLKNNSAREAIIDTLLPASVEMSTELSSGHLLCIGLFSPDPLLTWLAATAFSHVVQEDFEPDPEENLNKISLKEKLLQVKLMETESNVPVTLLQQCVSNLNERKQIHARIGILMFLSRWLSGCPRSVSDFLNIDGAMEFLTSQISSSEADETEGLLQGTCAFLLGICLLYTDGSKPGCDKASMVNLISTRIGADFYLERLASVTRHELFIAASKHPEISAASVSQFIFDYEFCKLFRATEGSIHRALLAKPGSHDLNENGDGDITLLSKYKNLIRQQDARLREYETRLNQMESLNATLQGQLSERNYTIEKYKDKGVSSSNDLSREMENLAVEDSFNLDHNITMDQLQKTSAEMIELKTELSMVKNQLDTVLTERVTLEAELESMKKDQEDLLLLFSDQESKLSAYKKRLLQLGEDVGEEEEILDDVDDV